MQTIDLSDLSVICGLWTCHYLFWSNVYIPRLSNCLMSIHVFIVRCVGGSKAPPVLHSSYRTVLNGTVLYDGRQGEGGRTFAFPRFGELSSA